MKDDIKKEIGKVAYTYMFDDHYEFPAKTFFYEKHGMLPSDYQITHWASVDSLLEVVKKLKEESDSIYIERYQYNKVNKVDELGMVAFDLKDYPQVLIIISPDSYSEGTKDNKKEWFTDTSLYFYYNPFKYDITDLKEIIEKIIVDPIDLEVKENKIKMIYSSMDGLDTKSFKIVPPTVDLKLNYEDGFEKNVHEYLLKELDETYKGIAILHGTPGTGKTMYLRHLVSILSSQGRSLIYIPPNMVDSLSNPEFLPLLAENPNSVLIIEDSENALRSRDSGNMAVTNLLSLADGLLSDSLNMQIIATFNTKLDNIDKAIMREGRLIINHEFKPLPAEKATALSKHIGSNKTYTEPKTLAEIYNYHKKKTNATKQKAIGFKSFGLVPSDDDDDD